MSILYQYVHYLILIVEIFPRYKEMYPGCAKEMTALDPELSAHH